MLPPTAREVYNVRQMLRVDDQLDGEQQTLIKLGERLFPTYLLILTAKDVEADEITRIFLALAAVKSDRSQFLEYVITGLSHRDDGVRRSAVQLLAHIGSSRDIAAVVALLSDKEWTVSIVAAKTLVAIGDRRALAAMDVWLATSYPRADRNARFDETHRQDIAKYRDELKARLDKEKKPAK